MSSRKIRMNIAVLLILFAALLTAGWKGHLMIKEHPITQRAADPRLQAAAIRNAQLLDHASFRPREYVKIVRLPNRGLEYR